MTSSGSSGSRLVKLMQEQAQAQLPLGIELGTVTVAPPKLRIQLDHMPVELEAADLIVCEHLLRHERIVTLEHQDQAQRNLGDKVVKAAASGESVITAKAGEHSPGLATYQWMLGQHKYLKQKFEDVLKPGDRVAVMALPGAQRYLIWDRVVDMSG